MANRTLAEVRTRIEDAVAKIPGSVTDSQSQFEQVLEVATATLDADFDQYQPLVLQRYLEAYLYLKQLELELIAPPDPREA